MPHLAFVTCLWAFSFPLIGYFISGQMDAFFAAFLRVFLAFLVFLPFLNFRVPNRLKLALMGVGAMQIGVMYLFYYHSFAYLRVSEVALFTIFTPFYVSFVYDFFARRFRALYLVSIALCVFGAFIIKYGTINSDFAFGFFLIQMANLTFGCGQSLYKIILERYEVPKQREIFGYFHLGASLITAAAFFALGDISKMPTNAASWAVLFYLGIVASGLGYFMWNKGATRVDSGVLAIMNNAVIPAAILANALIVALFTHFYSQAELSPFLSNILASANFSPDKQAVLSQSELFRIFAGTLIMFFSLWLHYKIIKRYERVNL